MKRSGLWLLALGMTVVLGGLSVYSQAQQEKKVSEEFRKQFVKDFKRIGLNTTPGDALTLKILIASGKCQRGVEVGTSTGYGAIVMGLAFERNGGHLTTLDIDPEAVKTARENIAKMGLEKTVTVVEGDALKTLPELQGEYDFVFIDALKKDYFKYFKAIEPKLRPGALVVADNVIRSANDMKDYLDFIQNSPDYDTVILQASQEKKDGMAVSYKLR
jgi:predicted O-methyltransferase YrrM